MDLTFKNPRVRETARLVHDLSADLRRMERGDGLTDEELARAPLLVDWSLAYRFELAMAGRVEGHPVLTDGPVTTSGLYLLDENGGFARTLSRFYRLGGRR
jgi:hypothetical protein